MAGPLAPLLIPLAIEAGGSIISSIFQSNSQNRALRELIRGGNEAQGTLKDLFSQSEKGFSPYTKGGAAAFTDIAEKQASGYYNQPFDMEKFNQDPGVKYRLEQAQLGLERSASARGRTLSGGTLRSLEE